MNVKTILAWLALAFVVFWVVESPADASHLIHNIGSFVAASARGLSNFFASI